MSTWKDLCWDRDNKRELSIDYHDFDKIRAVMEACLNSCAQHTILCDLKHYKESCSCGVEARRKALKDLGVTNETE